MRKKASSPWETVIVVLCIGILVSVIYNRYNTLERHSLYDVAKIDRQTVNMNLKLYKAFRGRYPDKLSALFTEKYLIDNDNLILAKSKIINGKLNDPFGNPYEYNSEKGRVYFSSGTKDIIREMGKL